MSSPDAPAPPSPAGLYQQTTAVLDGLFVRVVDTEQLVCHACGQASDHTVPLLVDWRDRGGVELLRRTTPAVRCPACGAPVPLRRPVVAQRPGDPIAAIVGYPDDTAVEQDAEQLGLLLRRDDVPVGLRPLVVASTPVRLEHLAALADRYTGFALIQAPSSGWSGVELQWLTQVRGQVEVPPVGEEIAAYLTAAPAERAGVAERSRSLLDPVWRPVVDDWLDRTVDRQEDPRAARQVTDYRRALDRLRDGQPPIEEEGLDEVTRAMFERAAAGAGRSSRLDDLRALMERTRDRPDQRRLHAVALRSYLATAGGGDLRTPESLRHAIEIGPEAVAIMAEVFGAQHPYTLGAMQDYAAALLDGQHENPLATERKAMDLFFSVARAAVAQLDRTLPDVLLNWAMALGHHTGESRTDNQELAVRLLDDARHVHRVLRPADPAGAMVIDVHRAVALRERRIGNRRANTREAVRIGLEVLENPAAPQWLGPVRLTQVRVNLATAMFQLRQLHPDEVDAETIVVMIRDAAAAVLRLTEGVPGRIRSLSNLGAMFGYLYQDGYPGRVDEGLLAEAVELTGRAHAEARRFLPETHDERIRVGANHVTTLVRPAPDGVVDADRADEVFRELLALATGTGQLGARYTLAKNYGQFCLGMGRTDDAITAFGLALDSVEDLYTDARSVRSRLAELGEAGDLAGWLAVSNLSARDAHGAVAALERSRARMLQTGPGGDGAPAADDRPVLYAGVGAVASWVILDRPGESPLAVRTGLTASAVRPLVTAVRGSRTNDELRASIDALTAELQPAILTPARIMLEENAITDLDVVTSGLLGGLPLHALPDGKDGRCWLHRATVRYVPSRAVGRRRRRRAEPGRPVLALGDSGGDLPCAGQEIRTIPAALGPAREVPDGSRRPWFFEALPSAGLVHVADHAIADPDEPLASTVRIGREETVTLEDVVEAGPLAADLVVLSCCSTGVPQEALADELVGFATGFELVGARAVIVSSWDIDDLSSSLVMVRFYALLGEGRDPGVALREAQLWVAGLTVADLDGLWAQAERAEPDALLPPGLAAEVSAFLLDVEQDPAARPFRHPAQFGGFLFHGPPPDLPSPRGGSSS